jgi:hypothetical protein
LRVLLVTALAIGLMFLASTWGLAAWHRAQPVPDSGRVSLRAVVENAPPSVATTDTYGPLGVLSMAYAGTQVEEGLLGEVAHPWIAISAHTGDYRALSAPELPAPAPGAVAMTGSGDRLAWATGTGVVLYDPVADETQRVALEGATAVGTFSDDGRMLTVHADGLRVLDLDRGEVVAEQAGTPASLVRRAAWRPDGSAVDYVEGDQLVTLPVAGGGRSTQPTGFAADADLSWSPAGDQLVGMQDVSGVRRLFSASLEPGGRLAEPQQVSTEGISLKRLIGFSSEHTVTVSAYLLESGAIERLIDIRLDGGPPIDLATLPQPGDNWVDSQTLAVATNALRAGSTDFGNHLWPWSYRARLATCALIGLFGLGLWLTRPPPAVRRRRGSAPVRRVGAPARS